MKLSFATRISTKSLVIEAAMAVMLIGGTVIAREYRVSKHGISNAGSSSSASMLRSSMMIMKID